MKALRILFIGASEFGHECLQAMFLNREIEIVGILTAPRDFEISYSENGVRNYLHCDIAGLYADRGFPLHVMRGKMNDPVLLEFVDALAPQAIVVAGWYHMIPRSIYSRYKVAGLHASLLPRYSGHAPLVWSILNNEKEAGISLYRIAEGVDTGEIIGSRVTPILFGDDIATLYGRIQHLAIDMLQTELLPWARNAAQGFQQDETLRTIMPPRTPLDGKLDWQGNALQIYNAVRAQSAPYPGAFTFLRGRRLGIERAHIEFGERAASDVPAGTLIRIDDDGLLVSCLPQECLLRIKLVKTGEGIIMPATEWAKGEGLRPGLIFG